MAAECLQEVGVRNRFGLYQIGDIAEEPLIAFCRAVGQHPKMFAGHVDTDLDCGFAGGRCQRVHRAPGRARHYVAVRFADDVTWANRTRRTRGLAGVHRFGDKSFALLPVCMCRPFALLAAACEHPANRPLSDRAAVGLAQPCVRGRLTLGAQQRIDLVGITHQLFALLRQTCWEPPRQHVLDLGVEGGAMLGQPGLTARRVGLRLCLSFRLLNIPPADEDACTGAKAGPDRQLSCRG